AEPRGAAASETSPTNSQRRAGARRRPATSERKAVVHVEARAFVAVRHGAVEHGVERQHLEEDSTAVRRVPAAARITLDRDAPGVREPDPPPAAGRDQAPLEQPQPRLDAGVERLVAREAVLAVAAQALAAADERRLEPGILAPHLAAADARRE